MSSCLHSGFRILSVRSELIKQGEPLYKAHVQLLSDRDLSRMRVSREGAVATIFGTLEQLETQPEVSRLQNLTEDFRP